MKNTIKWLRIIAFLFAGIWSAAAQDLIILKDGNIIEAKVTEIAPSEIRYKRFSHLDGPTIIIQKENVLTIRYEKGTYEIINAGTQVRQENTPANNFSSQQTGEVSSAPRSSISALLVQALNLLPAVPIAGNNLKFDFSVDSWIAKVNGRNFLAGTIMSQDMGEDTILTLKQTHTYLAGRRVSTPGPDMVLDYKKGPPASLRLVSRSEQPNGTASNSELGRQQDSAQMSSSPFEGIWVAVGSELFRFSYNEFTYSIQGKPEIRGTFTYNTTHIQINITHQFRGSRWVEIKKIDDKTFQNFDGRSLPYSISDINGVISLTIDNISPYGQNLRKQ